MKSIKEKEMSFLQKFFFKDFKKKSENICILNTAETYTSELGNLKCTWFQLLNDLPVFKLHTFKMAALKIFQHLFQGTLIIQWNIPQND